MIRQIVNYFIKFNKKDIKKLYKNEFLFREFYKKGTGVLLQNILGNIKKKKLKVKGLVKSNK